MIIIGLFFNALDFCFKRELVINIFQIVLNILLRSCIYFVKLLLMFYMCILLCRF